MQHFLPRFNRRFEVPAQCPEPAFRPMDPESRLGHILCFKHRRRVARDNTVKYYRHTLQLLPTQQRRSYAGAVVVVLEGLDGRLSLQHEGRIIASQEAPPSPASLRSPNETSPAATIRPSDPELASKPSVEALDPPGTKPDQEGGAHAAAIDDPEVAPTKECEFAGVRWAEFTRIREAWISAYFGFSSISMLYCQRSVAPSERV